MISEFHSIAGTFSPERKGIALDFKTLYLDPLAADMTLIHELEHHALTKVTDYGLATISLAEIKNIAKKSNKESFKEILRFMINAQRTVQESAATFIEMEHLKRFKGKRTVYNYIQERMPDDYRDRFLRLKDIFEASQKYRDFFTEKIPTLALQNGFRRRLASAKVTSIDELVKFVECDSETPDFRFEKLLDKILKNKAILNKTPEEICKVCGINYYGDTEKETVMVFLNGLLDFTDRPERLTLEEIGDANTMETVVSDTEKNLLITNLNINISSAEFLKDRETLLHYQDVTQSIMLMGVNGLDGQDELEALMNRQLNAVLVIFTKNGDKYLYSTSFDEVKLLLENEFKEIPIITKWGVYKPNDKISLFETKRIPAVVIYNHANDFINNFKEINYSLKFKYLHISTSADHPLHIFILKDDKNVIHTLNSFPKGIESIKKELVSILEVGTINDFKNNKQSINLSWNIWNGLTTDYDWFENLIDNK